MKNIIKNLTIVIMAFLSQSCQPDRKVHYLMIIDNVTKEIVEEFEKKFSSGENALEIRPVSGFGDISFTVFIPNAAGDERTIIFPSGNVEMEERKTKAKEFIAFLQKHRDNKSEERYVLRALDRLLEYVTDSNTNYHILNAGGLVENSGGALSLSTQKKDWLNGNFCFSNGQNCMGDHVLAAMTQLDRGPGWLFDDLIATHKYNPIMNRQTIYYLSTHSGLYRTHNGCSSKDVELFWQGLYARLNIETKQYTKGIAAFLNEPL